LHTQFQIRLHLEDSSYDVAGNSHAVAAARKAPKGNPMSRTAIEKGQRIECERGPLVPVGRQGWMMEKGRVKGKERVRCWDFDKTLEPADSAAQERIVLDPKSSMKVG